MNPTRLPTDHTPHRHSTGKRSRSTSPSPTARTSLPSIHQLHPFLPPTHGAAIAAAGTSGAVSNTPTQYLPNPMSQQYYSSFSAPMLQEDRKYSDLYSATPVSGSGSNLDNEGTGGADSDPEGDPQHDHSGPPKKKRRRQALSCTECKRRKIKCDRCQPCGPCMRRGEQDKCQWHVVEPIEKYVTRTEWDDLLVRYTRLEARYDRLEAFMLQTQPELAPHMGADGLTSSAFPSPAGPSRLPNLLAGPGVAGFQRRSPNPPPSTSSVAYSSSELASHPSSASPGSHHAQPQPSPPISAFHTPKFHLGPPPQPSAPGPGPPTSPRLTPMVDTRKQQTSRVKSRVGVGTLRPPASPALSSGTNVGATARRSPLSITSIIVTDPSPAPSPSPPPRTRSPQPARPKNWQAQTLPPPGDRLRPMPLCAPAPPLPLAHDRSSTTTPPPEADQAMVMGRLTPPISSQTHCCLMMNHNHSRPPAAAFSQPRLLVIHSDRTTSRNDHTTSTPHIPTHA